jgi:ribosomal protein S18 acetylase RimI-like enzyme
MAASEPWLTLQLDHASALAALNGPGREVYLARVGEAFAGHVVVNMGGALSGYIQILAVAPEWRSRGIGAALIQHAEQRIFRDSPNVFLCVSDFNERAQKFYACLGYERIGELKNYVIPGASEFLMRKTIGAKRNFRPAGSNLKSS